MDGVWLEPLSLRPNHIVLRLWQASSQIPCFKLVQVVSLSFAKKSPNFIKLNAINHCSCGWYEKQVACIHHTSESCNNSGALLKETKKSETGDLLTAQRSGGAEYKPMSVWLPSLLPISATWSFHLSLRPSIEWDGAHLPIKGVASGRAEEPGSRQTRSQLCSELFPQTASVEEGRTSSPYPPGPKNVKVVHSYWPNWMPTSLLPKWCVIAQRHDWQMRKLENEMYNWLSD